MEKLEITRAALGSTAAIGHLYDIRSDKLSAHSIYKREIPSDLLKTSAVGKSDIKVLNGSNSSYFKSLLVPSEQQLSILYRLQDLQNFGKIFQDQNPEPLSITMALHGMVQSEEVAFIPPYNAQSDLNIKHIQASNATHVVVGITCGSNVILSVKYGYKTLGFQNGEKTLRTFLEQTRCLLLGQDQADNGSTIKLVESDMSFQILSDINNSLINATGPMDAIQEMKNIFHSKGKGVPVVYRLAPVQVFLTNQVVPEIFYKEIEASHSILAIQIFERINAVMIRIQNILVFGKDDSFILPESQKLAMEAMLKALNMEKDKLKTSLKQKIFLTRSGELPMDRMNDPIIEFLNGEFSPNLLLQRLSTLGNVSEKSKFATEVELLGGKYIGSQTSLAEERKKDKEPNAVVLFFQNISKHDATWARNYEIFTDLIKDGWSEYRFYAVDLDVHDHSSLLPRNRMSCIQVLLRGSIVQKDLLSDIETGKNHSLIHTLARSKVDKRPDHHTAFTLPCTGPRCNKVAIHEWACKKCSRTLYYGFDDNIYCDCGKAPVQSLLFKCNDPKHGPFYNYHNSADLKNMLKNIAPKRELNILILGETGVGKSTWINSFVNFVTYQTLERAEENELISLIPTQFTVTGEDFKEITVKTGEHVNEDMKDGQSSTQESRVYTFSFDNTTIRIIDTPGIGDTRGIEQDEKNFENILDTLGQFDQLHGICVLLKPNQSKVNVMFRFCIKELLTHLHKDASKNIVFCFTNSRATFYRPGDTRRSLDALLKEMKDVEIPFVNETVYCFDSEVYRFLAATKNTPPVKFQADERENFLKSWDKSLLETNRMLDHFINLKPHPIRNTINLNHARQMIFQLTRPLAEIIRNIHENQEQLELELKKLEKTAETIDDLQRNLMVTRIDIERTCLERPRTVCGSEHCIKINEVEGKLVTEYVQVCHDRCSRNTVKRETVGGSSLKKCKAFTFLGTCKHCKHNYTKHLQLYYVSRQVPKSVEDPIVKSELRRNLSVNETKRRIIENKKTLIKEYQEEQKMIQESSIKFALFLKHNAITPYNDAMEEYLNHLIREEKNKVNAGGSHDTLECLEKTKVNYLHQRKVLEDALKKSENSFTPRMVEILINQLKSMKHNGENLTDALTCRSRAEQIDFKATEVQIPVKFGETRRGGPFAKLFAKHQ